MTWMLTATGAQVDLRWMNAGSVSLLDVAHHLSQLNRFTGACRRPYSVAEHSLLVVEILEREMAIRSPSALMAGLMHDAHEAYTQDLSTPMKQLVGTAWSEEEHRIQFAVLDRFQLRTAYVAHRDVLRQADLVALATERAALLPPAGPAWPCLEGIKPVSWYDVDATQAMTWSDWRDAFVERFAELSYGRKLQSAEL